MKNDEFGFVNEDMNVANEEVTKNEDITSLADEDAKIEKKPSRWTLNDLTRLVKKRFSKNKETPMLEKKEEVDETIGKASLSVNVEDLVEFIIEGDEKACTYTFALYKDHVEQNKALLNNKSLFQAPFSVDGATENLLCMLVHSSNENVIAKTLMSYGVSFVLARSDFDSEEVLFVVKESKAAERVFIDKEIDTPCYCYLSVYDIGLPVTTNISEEEDGRLGILRGVGIDGEIDFDALKKELTSISLFAQRLYLSSSWEERKMLGAQYSTPELALDSLQENLDKKTLLDMYGTEYLEFLEGFDANASLNEFISAQNKLKKEDKLDFFDVRSNEELLKEQQQIFGL